MRVVILLTLLLMGCGKEPYTPFVKGECIDVRGDICFVYEVTKDSGHLICAASTRILSHLDRKDLEAVGVEHCAAFQDFGN